MSIRPYLSNRYRWKSHEDTSSSACVGLYKYPQDILHRTQQQASAQAVNQGQSESLWNCAECTVSTYIPEHCIQKIPQDIPSPVVRNGRRMDGAVSSVTLPRSEQSLPPA